MDTPEEEEELICTLCGIGFCFEPCFNRGDQSLVQHIGSGNRTKFYISTQRTPRSAVNGPAFPLERGHVRESSALKERENAKSPEGRSVPPGSREVVADGAAAVSAPDLTQADQAHRTVRGRGEPPQAAAASAGRSVGSTPDAASSEATAPFSSRGLSAPSPTHAAGQRRPSAAESAALPPSVSEVPDSWIPQQVSALQAKSESADAVDPAPEYPTYATSRLSGLRKLLISLGRKSLLQDADSAGNDSDFEPRFERATVRPAYTPPSESEVQTPEGESSSPARVTITPEFLRPRPASEAEKEKEPLRPTTSQPLRDKPNSQDEIETLPSVRGQYRRKRYSPI